MPGHRRDNEPDDTTRVQDAVPAAGSAGGDAHGSTAVSSPSVSSPSASPSVGARSSLDQPTVARSSTNQPTVAESSGSRPTSESPTVVQPATAGTDRTPTTPATAVAPAAGHATPGHSEPVPQADQRPASTAGRKEVVAAQRARYGGISWGAAFFGWLSANGVAVLLIALLSALGVAFGLTAGLDDPAAATDQATSGIGLGAGIALLAALFLAYLAGGYVAGRMARFDGAKQGVAVWVIGLLVVLLLALAGLVFGSQYNVLSQLDLPRIPIDEGTATTAGIISLVAVLVVTLVAAVLGGLMGARYHRKVDRVGYDH
jgi:hypothetical protein